MDEKRSIKIERIPHDFKRDFTEELVKERRDWVSGKTNTKFSHISYYSIRPEEVKGNIENFIGVTQIPLGVLGPLALNGTYAKGTFYVPLATKEGVLLSTYQQGAIAITKSPVYHQNKKILQITIRCTIVSFTKEEELRHEQEI